MCLLCSSSQMLSFTFHFFRLILFEFESWPFSVCTLLKTSMNSPLMFAHQSDCVSRNFKYISALQFENVFLLDLLNNNDLGSRAITFKINNLKFFFLSPWLIAPFTSKANLIARNLLHLSLLIIHRN